MGFRFRRSIKLFPGLRLNFGKRGISTSIGVRGAHVTFGKSGTRTTVGLPGTGLSYTHLDRPHREVSIAATAAPTTDEASQGSAGRGFFWIGLIVTAVVIAIVRVSTPAPPVQLPATSPTQAEIASQAAAQASRNERSAEVDTAALGVTRIRRTIANANTLSLSRITVMPQGTICYRFNLRNSRGHTYVRKAMMDGAVLKVSGSDGFTPLWNSRCVHDGGRDITSDVNVIR